MSLYAIFWNSKWKIDWPALAYTDAVFLLSLPLQGFSDTIY